MAKTYLDRVKCPVGHKSRVLRRVGSAGRVVQTYCVFCKKAHQIKAGPVPAPTEKST